MPLRSVGFTVDCRLGISGEWAGRSTQIFQRGEAALVLFRGADGDANPLGHLIAAHVPRDDAVLLQF